MSQYTSKDEAERHAQAIRDYWAAQDKYPVVRVDTAILPDNTPGVRAHGRVMYQVRSDMINGCPQ